MFIVTAIIWKIIWISASKYISKLFLKSFPIFFTTLVLYPLESVIKNNSLCVQIENSQPIIMTFAFLHSIAINDKEPDFEEK